MFPGFGYQLVYGQMGKGRAKVGMLDIKVQIGNAHSRCWKVVKVKKLLSKKAAKAASCFINV
jgi:hypothetical protein